MKSGYRYELIYVDKMSDVTYVKSILIRYSEPKDAVIWQKRNCRLEFGQMIMSSLIKNGLVSESEIDE